MAPSAGPDESPFIGVDFRGRQQLDIEYRWVLPDNQGPLIVFLHEGLGSMTMWRGFPRALCERTGCRGLVYSRCGYGWSSPLWPASQWPVEFMHTEAEEILPRLLQALRIDSLTDPPILLGHSDGGSIALIYAAYYPRQVAKIITLSPHTCVEALTVDGIRKTRELFLTTDLPSKLGRYHADIQQTFWGWISAWLATPFLAWNIETLLADVHCPVLAIQGFDDRYGTMHHLDTLHCKTGAELLKLPNCGHSPHLDCAQKVLAAVADFVARQPR